MRANITADVGRSFRITTLALAVAQAGCGGSSDIAAPAPPEAEAPQQSIDTGALPQTALGSSSAFVGFLLVLIQKTHSDRIEPARVRPRQTVPADETSKPAAIGG